MSPERQGERTARLPHADMVRLLAVLAAATALVMLTARPAYAVSVQGLIENGPFAFVAMFVIEIVNSALNDVLIPLCGQLFSWTTDYLSIPYVNTVILGLQGISIVAVIALRVAKGITSGILLNGGNREASLGEYLFTSLYAVVLVAIMPFLCNLVIHFGNLIFNDVVKGGTIENTLSWMSLGDDFDADAISGDEPLVHATLWTVVGLLVMMVLTVGCGYQFLRRQVEMVVVAMIGPLVAIYSATEDSNSQVYDLLRKLFGLCCLMWIQYLLVRIALEFGQSWVAYATSTNTGGDAGKLLEALFQDDGARRFLFSLAFFGAALTLPNLLDQFTFGGGGSRIGGVVVGGMVSRAMPRRGGGGAPHVSIPRPPMGGGRGA